MIELKNVSMCFNLGTEKIDSLKDYMVKFIHGKIGYEEFWALRDVSFNIQKGQAVGLLGLNGAGKSTLLKIIAGVLKPTKGRVNVNGKVSPLIELGAGFDVDLTGRENIFLNGALLGYSEKFLKQKFDEIVDFAALGEFINVPLKNYSSGMFARLGFSIATIVNPEILILDEVLSVGDFHFQKKCQARIQQMMSADTTVIYVSHSIESVREICDQAIWLEKGRIRMIGPAQEVCQSYQEN